MIYNEEFDDFDTTPKYIEFLTKYIPFYQKGRWSFIQIVLEIQSAVDKEQITQNECAKLYDLLNKQEEVF